ncbi:MAG TPA: hypothetical protein VK502_00720 [Candidatus Saccharimonadales bacterium]|nr:hypothetical protein [Candidatus Saccharimonadales bacterium]
MVLRTSQLGEGNLEGRAVLEFALQGEAQRGVVISLRKWNLHLSAK